MLTLSYIMYNIMYNMCYFSKDLGDCTSPQWRPWHLDKHSAQIPTASYERVGPGPAGTKMQFISRRTFIVLKSSNKPVIYYWLKSSSSFMFFDLLDAIHSSFHLMLVWLPRSISYQVHSLRQRRTGPLTLLKFFFLHFCHLMEFGFLVTVAFWLS